MSMEIANLCPNCVHVLHNVQAAAGGLWARRPAAQPTPKSCRLCGFIETGVSQVQESTDFPPKLTYRLHERPDGFGLEFGWRAAGKWNAFELTGYEASFENATKDLVCTKSSSQDTLSEESVSFLQSKLKDCLSNHMSCNRISDNARQWYPRRLLSIQGQEDLKVYLVNSENTTTGPYFTLSHCWGNIKPIELTTTSEPSLRAGVDISTLPKTFQDAIRACKEMEIPYLWIDSMCIFQDRLDDWHVEAALMREVYSFAQCNIAATGATNSSIGLSFERDSSIQIPFKVKTPGKGRGGSYYLVCPPDWCKLSLEQGPLNKRAWVLQERFLSKRIMHFTATGVYWECLTTKSSDKFPDSLPIWMTSPPSNASLKQRLNKLPSMEKQKYPLGWAKDLYTSWLGLLEAYTRCNLTHEADKLVAINGISQTLAYITGDSFIGGLWQRHISEELLWRRAFFTAISDPRPPKRWRAPTWSWANTNFPIRANTAFRHRECKERKILATVGNIHVDSYPSGQLRNASMTLRGRIIHVMLSIMQKTDQHFQVFRITGEDGKVFESELGKGSTGTAVFLDSQTMFPYQEKLVCLAVYECNCTIENAGHELKETAQRSLEALALRELDTQRKTYERVGVLTMRNEGHDYYKTHESKEEHSIIII